jgi:hypothetical protein
MGTQEPGQEWLDGYRYQLATMAYAVAAAQYHRMPAARSALKPLMGRIIHKMLRREVWGYWFLTSHSGSFVDPDLKELRKPWADPICKENIMVSGNVALICGHVRLILVVFWTLASHDSAVCHAV